MDFKLQIQCYDQGNRNVWHQTYELVGKKANLTEDLMCLNKRLLF